MVARCVGAIDIAELTLKAEVDDHFHIGGLELDSVDLCVLLIRTVAIDRVEQLGKTATEFIAQAAIRAQLENPLDLGAEILCIPELWVDGVVGRGFGHLFVSFP